MVLGSISSGRTTAFWHPLTNSVMTNAFTNRLGLKAFAGATKSTVLMILLHEFSVAPRQAFLSAHYQGEKLFNIIKRRELPNSLGRLVRPPVAWESHRGTQTNQQTNKQTNKSGADG